MGIQLRVNQSWFPIHAGSALLPAISAAVGAVGMTEPKIELGMFWPTVCKLRQFFGYPTLLKCLLEVKLSRWEIQLPKLPERLSGTLACSRALFRPGNSRGGVPGIALRARCSTTSARIPCICHREPCSTLRGHPPGHATGHAKTPTSITQHAAELLAPASAKSISPGRCTLCPTMPRAP